MRRTTPALVAVMLVVSALAAFPMAGLAGQTTDAPTESNESANATVSPGERLAGVVGVKEAELEGEVDSRAYGIKVARAASNDSRAAIVAEQLGDVEARLTDLEERRQALDEARANGSMNEGEYRARMARLAAETRTVQRLTNQSNETAQGLSEETLRSNGVDVSAIRTLSERASELGGPEVAAIARSIAGESAGDGFGPEKAGADRGTGALGNETGGQDRGTDARDDGEDGAAADQNATDNGDQREGQTGGGQQTADTDGNSAGSVDQTAQNETTATETDSDSRRDDGDADGETNK